MINSRKHIAFFSQSGSEIVKLSHILGKWPDLIVTNQRPSSKRTIHPELEGRVAFVENIPTEEELSIILSHFQNPLVTLHGWLRIFPEQLCKNYEIYNSHPGLITKYPSLKGAHPQLKAFNNSLTDSGCVIHRVVPEVDSGEILLEKAISIEGLTLDEVFHILHETSINLWVEFFKDKQW